MMPRIQFGIRLSIWDLLLCYDTPPSVQYNFSVNEQICKMNQGGGLKIGRSSSRWLKRLSCYTFAYSGNLHTSLCRLHRVFKLAGVISLGKMMTLIDTFLCYGKLYATRDAALHPIMMVVT